MEHSQHMKEDSSYFYFAYGSNMLKERIQINDPNAVQLCAAKLEGFKLDFNYKSLRWQGAVANILESPGSEVWGVVWIKHNSTIASLDEQEGVQQSIYKPVFVEVITKSGEKLMCRCYQQVCALESDKRPSQVYKNVMVCGAKENGVPESYIQSVLMQVKDNGYTGEVHVKLALKEHA